ncbi:DUF1848 domain-containing protein [Gracilinema caldarium]|uniref:DUF1848 domain-containing protein n=1 Tax=Gracilinema caldarium TaxID=215591 RepID=UPI00145E2AA0|nr:DUF1848 domain-containing protein [Gracilinema caldarium]
MSRRSDVPRFYWDWFLGELERGETVVVNPFNTRQVKKVSLLSQDVDGFVFWTREPYRIRESAGMLLERGYQFYVMVSLTGYPAIFEPQAPPLDRIIDDLHRLSACIGSERVFWRYDPILLSSLTSEHYHVEQFQFLAGALATAVGRCIVSLYDPYAKSDKRLRALETERLVEIYPLYKERRYVVPEAVNLLGRLADIAHQYRIPIYSCAEPDGLVSYGILPHACVDGSLFGLKKEKDPHQRSFCRCDRSIDIGRYGTCPARCLYCYAW